MEQAPQPIWRFIFEKVIIVILVTVGGAILESQYSRSVENRDRRSTEVTEVLKRNSEPLIELRKRVVEDTRLFSTNANRIIQIAKFGEEGKKNRQIQKALKLEAKLISSISPTVSKDVDDIQQ